MKFPNGKESQTTFFDDFSIADTFGKKAIKDTYKRAFNEWKDNCVYLTELVIVLNLKCWEHYYHLNISLSELYSELYYKAHHYAQAHLKGDDARYYFEMTD